MQWQSDPNHYARAFRENYSNLNWLKIFEEFGELDEEIDVDFDFNKRAYEILIQIYTKSKPPNLQIPITHLLERQWASPEFQFLMIKYALQSYIAGDDRTFNFGRTNRKI